MIRVAVLDDHPAMRAGLEAMLAPAPDPAAVIGADAILSKASRAGALLDPSDHAIFAMRLAGNSPVEIADTLSLADRRSARSDRGDP